MAYLLKITIVWSLFLLLFEVLYKSNGKFIANRLYLLLSVAAGLLLPLVRLPRNAPSIITATQSIYPAAIAPVRHAAAPVAAFAKPGFESFAVDPWLIISIVYLLGFVLLAFKCGRELVRMRRLVRHGERRVIHGCNVIVTRMIHAPYSFMDWVFIGDPAAYTTGELDCIIRHESAHNRKMHWLDLALMHAVCILLWFHPLVWRYRYLLQLQHEYEADGLAAANDAFGYGHFLLQQTLLSGVPSIAHSFHFSPIKNRIIMLTNKQGGNARAWKYLLLLPALAGCTFLMAKTGAEKVRQEAVTTYKGNTFLWRETDTLFYDRKTNTPVIKEAGANKKRIIVSMNGEPVFRNGFLETPASYGNDDWTYTDYVRKEFAASSKSSMDSLTTVEVSSVVINKEGKVVYCDLRFYRPYYKCLYFQTMKKEWQPGPNASLNGIMDRIISQSPAWKPAVKNGKPVNCMVSFAQGGC